MTGDRKRRIDLGLIDTSRPGHVPDHVVGLDLNVETTDDPPRVHFTLAMDGSDAVLRLSIDPFTTTGTQVKALVESMPLALERWNQHMAQHRGMA